MRFPRSRVLVPGCVLLLAACEGGGAHPAGPKGRDAFAHFVAIGTGITMGVQSGGVVYAAQEEAWPALLASQAGATFDGPLLRTPGCPPPLIAPLELGRYLSGTSVTTRDSSCAGVLGSPTPPLGNLALPGTTAWTAVNLTPKAVLAVPSKYAALDRARYPLALGSTQSQVTAMIVERPSLVAIEIGFTEVIGAVVAGQLAAATSYTQAAPFTYVPAQVFAPVFAAIADSVKKSGARAVVLSVPHATRLVALRAASELWADRASLATFGVTVAADCASSANRVFTPSVIPGLVALAALSVSPQALSCADVPGTTDAILTPAEITALDAVTDEMNAHIRQLADQNGWALADLDAEYAGFFAARAPYRATEELRCAYPYGEFLSLDGVHPNSAGHHAIANAVATALNERFGFDIPIPPGLPLARPAPCP